MAKQAYSSAAAQQKYLETSIATASREDLIIKIFDALILASTQALEKLETQRHDIEGIHKALLRAQRACCLLMGSLDMEIGGDVATNLFRIYEFWHHELVMANMQKDPQRVSRLMPAFKEFRQTWLEAVTQFKASQRDVPGVKQRPLSPTTVSSFAAVG